MDTTSRNLTAEAEDELPEAYEPGEAAPVDNVPAEREKESAHPDEEHPAAGGAGEPYHA